MNKRLAVFTALFICALPLCAQNPAFTFESPPPKKAHNGFWGSGEVFKLSLEADLPLLIGGALATAGGFTADSLYKPAFPTSFDLAAVNALDRSMARPYNRALDISGDVVMSLSIAMPAVLFSLPLGEWTTFLTMYLESSLWAFGLNTLVKAFSVRSRPYMYFPGAPESTFESADQFKSMPSRHTTMAVTGAVFASYVFWKYNPNSVWRYPVIAASSLLAAGTATLRILSGNHFFTDVLTGAAIGGLAGFLVPFIHTLNAGIARAEGYEEGTAPVELRAVPGGISLSLKW